MTQLMQANRQWATRFHDQRFTTLTELADFTHAQKHASRSRVVPSGKIGVKPSADNRGLLVALPGTTDYVAPTHWSFGQLAQLVGAPADYLRGKLPAPIAADCLNYGFRYGRDTDDVGMLVTERDTSNVTELRAATGPQYGRIWNADLVDALVTRFGDGISGDWRVPGEFGNRIQVTKENTTIFASDRDMFVFLADEDHRIEVRDRRNGEPGSLARGFFVWNSEVGKTSLGAAFFLFDYVCCNRIVWGARDFTEIRVRHTSGAPERWLEEVQPVLIEYAETSARPIVEIIESAKGKRLDDVDKFLADRFGKRMVSDLKEVHLSEEHRPIETLWDATTAVTARARMLPFQDQRVELERDGGRILQLAA